MTRDHISHGVARIRWSFGDNWTGEESLFLRVVISDEARLDKARFSALVRSVTQTLTSTFCDFSPAYVNFRSVSECARIKDPEWE
jgi:hypothetical protein